MKSQNLHRTTSNYIYIDFRFKIRMRNEFLEKFHQTRVKKTQNSI